MAMEKQVDFITLDLDLIQLTIFTHNEPVCDPQIVSKTKKTLTRSIEKPKKKIQTKLQLQHVQNVQHVQNAQVQNAQHLSNFSDFCELLCTECPDMKQILSRLDTSSDSSDVSIIFKDLKHQYLAVKGHVQSGKTKFMLCFSLLCLWFDISPIIVLRNLHSDAAQFMQRLDDFRPQFHRFIPMIKIITSSTKMSTKRVKAALYLCLGNGPAIKKISKVVSDHYICLLDEVDAMDMGRTTSRNEQMSLLKQRAFSIIGISATMLDPLVKEKIATHNIILLQTSSDYKGMKEISFLPIQGESVFSNRVDDDLTLKQPGLMKFLHDFSLRSPIVQGEKVYPNIVLVNVGATVAPYMKLQKRIQEDIPSLCTILYNANGITVYSNGCEYKRNDTISETLQWLKDSYGVQHVPTIAIFSCLLAGRGVSFVSEDYQWHLNVLYLCVSATCDEAELLQKVRLAGRYHDTIPLELYTTSATYADMLKAYYKQEEIVYTVLQSKSEVVSDVMIEMTLAKEKFSKRRVIKDGVFPIAKSEQMGSEWSTDVYDGMAFPPKEWYETYGETKPNETCRLGERLVIEIESDDEVEMGNEGDELRRLERKMFPTWGKKIGTSRIASWMDALDPERVYNRNEIMELCKQHEIILQHVLVAKYEKSGSKGYGKILSMNKGMYQLNPYLVAAHKMHF
jgi:hypothetical protein